MLMFKQQDMNLKYHLIDSKLLLQMMSHMQDGGS